MTFSPFTAGGEASASPPAVVDVPAPRSPRRAVAPFVACGILGLVTACSDSAPSDRTTPTAEDTALNASSLTGPICDLLPSGDEPGNPEEIAALPVDEVLSWIPVATYFEAAVRASGLTIELAEQEGITVLVPTDDAWTEKFSEQTSDDLLLFRDDELTDLVRAHVIDGELDLEALQSLDSVTTLDGASVRLAEDGSMVAIADAAHTVCGDYRAANARVHIIDGVLGNLPDDPKEDREDSHSG